jgi:hypothetical protein
MSEDVGPIEIEADTEPVEEAIADCEQKLDTLEEDYQSVESDTRASMRRVTWAISGVAQIANSMMMSIGDSMDPLGRALIGCVTSTVSALRVISMSMTSNPITAIFAEITAVASIVLSIRGVADVLTGIDRSKSEIEQARSFLTMLHGLYIFGRGAQY